VSPSLFFCRQVYKLTAGIFYVSQNQTMREYQKSRVEFDAYRTDLEKLQALQGTQNAPKDLDQKLETSTASFIQRKETLDKFREALIVKLKLLDENRHKVSESLIVWLIADFRLCRNSYCYFTTASRHISLVISRLLPVRSRNSLNIFR
jgi:hypothetical protein